MAIANRPKSFFGHSTGKGICAKHQEASEACECRNSLIPDFSFQPLWSPRGLSSVLQWHLAAPKSSAGPQGTLTACPGGIAVPNSSPFHFRCVLKSPFCNLHTSQTLPYRRCSSACLWCQGWFFLQVIWFIYSNFQALLPAQKSDISLANAARLKL